jgi:flavin-dependent dehydrogenase
MTIETEAFDVIILGAGAAGLMCALAAGQRGRKVLLLEHADRVGAQILHRKYMPTDSMKILIRKGAWSPLQSLSKSRPLF